MTGPEGPRRPGGPPGLAWDTTGPVPVVGPAPGRPRWSVVAVVLAVLVVAGVIGAALLLRPVTGPPAPDRYSGEEVALRFRALGATLLDGALRCGPLPAAPGETERARCDFGSWSLDLTSYDSPDRLREVRAAALVPAPDSARSARASAEGAAFAMDQAAPGPARIYWDVEDPRPVSALATTTELPMSELVAAYDARRFAALARPEQPGAAFVSPALWSFAAGFVASAGGSCHPRAPGEGFAEVVEQVDCDFPNGVPATFALATGDPTFLDHRSVEVSSIDTVPGTQRIGTWRDDGQLVEYINADQNIPYLYYDRRDLRCFGVLWDDALTQDQLRQFWAEHHG